MLGWGIGRPRVPRDLWTALVVACLSLALPAIALAANPAFPGTDPAESPRANTPDDSDFDECEGDDRDVAQECSTYFEEEFRAFGFSPDSANQLPPAGPHYLTGTKYLDCTQPTQEQKDASARAEGVFGTPQAALAECLQPSGVSADMAWKYSTGNPQVSVAILDTGIRWQDRELVNKIRLNAAELPTPQHDGPPREGSPDCSSFASADDANGDGAFNVRDFVCDSRVSIAAGDDTRDTSSTNADDFLDGSDLIARFSGGDDSDGNGYADDIAGWDFFDDDNDPYDASSCCSANGHGTGRGRDAAAETNNGTSTGPGPAQEGPANTGSGVGMCPDCQVMPLRVWDSFVVPIDSYAMGTLYAAQNGASVVEGAVGGLGNTQFARSVFRYADQQGLALMMVSSDINSANHNYPTNYNEAVYVAGAFPDTAPNETCSGPGGLPGFGEVINPPEEFGVGCQQFLGLLAQGGVTPTTQPITTSFFRNSNLTQYGGKADIVLEATTGSQNTGQAAGAAGLLASFGRETFGAGNPLSGNEIRQLLTMSAEDVKPLNTGIIGQPDKANEGWDPHFGYGRVNLAAAMKRIADDRVPPEAQIDSPDWFAPIDVDRVGAGGVDVNGRIAAPHGGVGDWRLEYACGQDIPDGDASWTTIGSGTGVHTGVIGNLSQAQLNDLADNCNGEVTDDAGRPAGANADGAWPNDPYPNPDPESHAFQIRLTVESTAAFGGASNFGRYRKTLFAYNDDGNLSNWPRPIGEGSDANSYVTGSGGEVSPRLYDLDGDNELDILQPTTSGELHALHADGSPVASFNGGNPVKTDRYQLEQNHPVPGAVATPHESLRAPAIGDITGDREAEIVATAGEHVYAWHLDGARVASFPVLLDRSLSDPCLPGAPHPCFDSDDRAITGSNHIKRGFFGSPALADLDCDQRLDVVAAAMDQYLYAWRGTGAPLPGFPKKLASAGANGAEIVTSPAIAELDGRPCGASGPELKGPEVVVSSNEVVGADPSFPENPSFPGSFLELFNLLIQNATGSNPVYAVHSDGTDVNGWPVEVGVAAGDLLPLVVPGHDSAVLDSDGDGVDEVSVSAATSIEPGGTRLVNGAGQTVTSYQPAPANSPDQGAVFNLADYQSVGDITGAGTPAVVKGGLTLNGAANLLAVNQNLPFSHVEQAWDSQTGAALPGYPRATDDFQLVSQASIARVGGGGPERQALVGTGLYQLHAYGTNGLEPNGWPKFTGGWMQATPAVGDADGDGDLDVTTVTREGWSFLWDTEVPACGGSNDEWWTFHHDERNTANYGVDGRPPGTPEGLLAARNAADGVDLGFTAPGDDWLCGQAAQFRVTVSANPIQHPNDGTAVGDFAAGVAAGETQPATLSQQDVAGANFLAVFYRDEAGNWGRLASAPVPPSGGGPTDTDGDGVNDDADNCPAIANPGQEDADGDDIGDVCEGDSDGDGVHDDNGPGDNDNCDSDPNPNQADSDGDGVGNVCDPTPNGNPAAGTNPPTSPPAAACSNPIDGTRGKDVLTGTSAGDRITGRRGRDTLTGLEGADCLFGNRGRDVLAGGPGADLIKGGLHRDRIDAADGEADTVKCGRGRDRAIVDAADRLKACEKVRRA
jgi:hemolysin type calcium-binding protein/thrombospondin type 3 repeat protein